MPPSTQPRDRRYTWTDYQTWSDDERWEIIDGVAYNMSPTDVRLSETDVAQPDILVVSDPAKITPSHIEGAPELVVEVLSPSTSARDLREKKWLYQRSGVREYIVVDPLEFYVQRFLLSGEGRYGEPEVFGPEDVIPLVVLDGLTVDLREILEWSSPDTVSGAS